MSSHCQHCGAYVSEGLCRVFGDETNTLHRCLACDTKPRLQRGSGAGWTLDWPDPDEYPDRNRSIRTDATDDGIAPSPGGDSR